jgi:transposase
MSPYSRDLRQRIIDTVERGEGSLRQIALRFLVSLSFVTRLLRHYRTTGSLEPKPHGGGRPPALRPAQLKRLRALIRKKPDATLEELRRGSGVDCSHMAIVRALQKLKITRKKKVLHAQEQDTPEGQQKRRDFLEAIAGIDANRLVFVDESGAKTSMTRTYGRAPVGERVHGAVPGHWDSVTLICGLRLSGVTAPVVFQGATDTPAFQSYVEQVLVPALESEDVVIWDNLQPHKAAAVVAAVEQSGARVIPLPPSSPDLTPIEEMFSKVKEALRSVAARSTTALYVAIGSALHGVSQQDILGWFQSRAAYAFQS